MGKPVAARRPMPIWETFIIVFLPLALVDVLVYSILDLNKVQSGWVQAIAYIICSIVVFAFDSVCVLIWVLNKYHGGVMSYNAPKVKRPPLIQRQKHGRLVWFAIGFVLTTLMWVYIVPYLATR